LMSVAFVLFFSSRSRHTRSKRDWSSDVCSSDLIRKTADSFGKMAIGTVHHITFEVADEESLNYWLEAAKQRGYHTSDIKNRDYFKSLYFRERGGILIELATAGPGFTW